MFVVVMVIANVVITIFRTLAFWKFREDDI